MCCIIECFIDAKGEENEEEKAHYMYLCRKKFDAQEKYKKYWTKVESDLKKEYEEELKYA